MYSFEGNYRLKRTVNLGGKQKESKELLLRKVANDRKKRDNERRRHNAAILLQKIIRSRIVMKHVKDTFRLDFDHDILKYKSTLNFSEDLFLKNIKRLIFFYQLKNDFYRLYEIVDIISRYIDFGDMSFFHVFPSISSWVTCRFGGILIETLNFTSDIMFHKKIFGLLPDLACSNVFLISSGYYKELCLYICKNETSFTPSIMSLFFKTIMNPLKHFLMSEYLVQKIVLSEFIVNFFVLTKKYDDLLDSVIYQLKLFFSNIIFLRIILDINFECFLEQELLWILHNILLYVVDSDKKRLILSSFDEIDLYSRCVSEILMQIFKKVRVPMESYHYDNSDNESIDNVQSITNYKIVSEKLFFELNLTFIFSTEHIAEIIAYVSPSTVVSISKFFVMLMEIWPSKKSEIMTQLVIISTDTDEHKNINILFVLWERVKLNIAGLQIIENIDVCKNNIFSTWNDEWYTMLLLFELYSRILMTMIDEEFIDLIKKNHAFYDIRILVDFLKDLSYALYCYNEYSETQLYVYDINWLNIVRLRNVVTRLIHQLFIRDSRKQFFPHDYWLMTNRFDMSIFMPFVISEMIKNHENYNNKQLPNSFFGNEGDNTLFSMNILRDFPFYLPFSVRMHILRNLIDYDMDKFGHSDSWNIINRFYVTIRRNNIFNDGFESLYTIGKDIKKPINIVFIDQYGLPEVGIDGGGITKEFLTCICKQALDVNFGLFHETSEHMLYPNPHSYACESSQLQCFEFLGKLIGKCIYESVLLDVTFAPFFLTKILGKKSYLDDLVILDFELYKGLMFLKRYTGDVQNDFSLNFTIIEQEFGKTTTIELIPGGSDISVTNTNRLQYIYTMADYRLNKVISKQSYAFAKGLFDIIDIKWLSMFSSQELQKIIGGSSLPIDIDDLRNNSVYGGFHDNDPTIELFWSVLYEFSVFERQTFLKFVTSVSRPPLLGFKDLKPLFCIRDGGDDTNRLPTASTCINLLILPRYNDKATMKR
ncbi:hypothetical protein T552_03441 [Pneumocystis carinii B80]|uniref:HECT-type E3 ubiquitin transferase n=1 Tax=Pneumocystis carinii (strain B80) TaxID=1408658 RepID=A0A0W4ZB81_PNEC8|nr:hypothetical protein T552_03441 [Pneumocystis carinii B80]KTW25580.1 hypothetical protein T552_03441 [Pneumocystis carinii B80]